MHKITAEKMVYGGFALARTEQGVAFVEGLLPGETGEVEQIGKKGGIPYYQVTNILERSSDRREPSCTYFSECGGCNWLHYNYEAQLTAKRDIFFDAFTRIGKIADTPEPEIISGPELHYRRRVQFKVDEKSKRVGFFKKSSNEVIAIDSCPLLSEPLNAFLADSQTLLKSDGGKRGFMMIDTGSGVVANPAVEGTSSRGTVEVGDYSFQVKGDSFFQANRFLTEKMGQWCSDELKGKRLLDLFGGVGLFSLFHGTRFEETVLVEQSKPMARNAEKGFRNNGFHSGKALGMTSERFFERSQPGEFDTVIVDPPRTGLSKEVRQGVAKLNPETILYISCNPTTQARDVSFFVEQHNYRMKRTALFDLYPNTSHMESGVLLVRS